MYDFYLEYIKYQKWVGQSMLKKIEKEWNY